MKMKKNTRIIILGIIGTLIALGLFLGILYLIYKNDNKTLDNKNNTNNTTYEETITSTNKEETTTTSVIPEVNNNQNEEVNDTVTIYLFHGSTCPHCVNAIQSITENINKYENFNIITYEVWNNSNNYELMNKVGEKLDAQKGYVPFFVIGTESMVGFNESDILQIAQDYLNNKNYTDVVQETLKENPELEVISNNLKS